jgi:DNA-binding beta-propeller fold protein YncE
MFNALFRSIGVMSGVLLLGLLSTAARETNAQSLQLKQTIPLPSVQGKFDHLAADVENNRLFVAATGNHSIEVIDLKTGKVEQSIGGLSKPHGLVWAAATGSLYVADGGLAELRVYRGRPLALAGAIKLSDDADDMAYDPESQILYVGHGGTDAANPAQVAIVDTKYFMLVVNLPVATHPEALDFDAKDHRVFVNIADANEVAVLDTESRTITAHWKITDAADNVPLAYDVDHQRLYVACRTPGKLLALDTTSGKMVASVAAAGKADDLFYDASHKRVYLISGAGEVDSYKLKEAGMMPPLGVTHTVPSAKTGLFVPSKDLLYIAVPGTGSDPAGIRVYAPTSERGE